MNTIRIPKKITPDPILDSVIEFRFDTQLRSEESISSFYKFFCDDFPFYNEVPLIIQPSADFISKISLRNDKYSVSFGHRVIAFSCINGYKGWDNFSPMVYKYFETLSSKNLVGEISRIGIRYVNFFKDILSLSKNINLKIDFAGSDLYESNNNSSLRTQLKKGLYGFNLIVADNVSNNSINGSIVDIDTYFELTKKSFDQDLIDLINGAHSEEKILFFSLLKPDFLDTFKPEY